MSYEKIYEKLKSYKLDLLKELDIDKNNFFEKKLEILDFNAYSINLYNPGKPNLVYIHGYSSCCYLNFILFKYLKNDFNLYAIDLAGFGLSSYTIDSSKKEVFNSTESCLEYYLLFIYNWIKILKIKEFYLVGHSFGGYLASHFLNKYNDQFLVKNLILISPGGFIKASDDKHDNLKNIIGNRNRFIKIIITKIADFVFERKNNLFKFYFKPIKYFSLKNKVKNYNLNTNLSTIFYNIWDITTSSMGVGADVIFYIFHYGTRSKKPICEIYKYLLKNYKVNFYYGDRDYMDSKDTIEYYKNNNLNINVKFINEACHDIPITNSNLLYSEIMNDLK